MQSSRAPALWAGLVALALPAAAAAYGEYQADVPNGDKFGCLTCHSRPEGGLPCNSFGLALLNNDRSWAAVVDLDSDFDDQRNGQELGDPCGDWSPGAEPPRTTEISNPGDPQSTSATPAVPVCDAGTAIDGAGPDGARDAGFVAPDRTRDEPYRGWDAAREDAGYDAQQLACTPYCIDAHRVFACLPSGDHEEQYCPVNQFCENGICAFPDEGVQPPAKDSDGCGCRAGRAAPGALAWLALLALLRRRHG